MFSDRTEIDTLADEEFAKLEQRVKNFSLYGRLRI